MEDGTLGLTVGEKGTEHETAYVLSFWVRTSAQPKPGTRSPKPETRNLTPETPNPEAETLNPLCCTLNPQP